MSLFARLEQRSTLHPRDPALAEWFGGGSRASSGMVVTPDKALGVMAVWASIRLISETLAQLPLVVNRRLDRGREKFTSHPLYSILHDNPNEWQTALEWREMMQAHVLLRGNAYSVIKETRGGYVEQLVPLHPDRVVPRYEALKPGGPKVRYYAYQPNDGPLQVLMANEVFHIRGLSSDGLSGLSPVTVGRETLGLAMAAQMHGARHFANNAQPGGVLEHPGKFKSDDVYKRLKAEFDAARAGVQNAGKTIILEEGMKWHQIGLTNKDAQYLESRKFEVAEIARMFKVPPHMIADLDKATFSNIEHQAIEFVVHTMLPWLVRWEQRIAKDLLGPTERKTIFPKFNADGLLRGDTKSRFEAYAIARQWGWLSADDVRELEDMNPLPGGQGNIYFVPLNMVPADQAGLPAPKPALALPASTDPDVDEDEDEDRAMRSGLLRRRLEIAHVRLFLDAATRVMRKEAQAARRAVEQARAKRSTAPLDRFVEEFYADHEQLVTRTLLPAIQTTAEAIAAAAADEVGLEDARGAELAELAEAIAANAGRRHVARQREEARGALVGTWEQRAQAFEALVTVWEARAKDVAGSEIEIVSAAAQAAVYRCAGLLPAPAGAK